jgi:hypothetical protein
MRNSPEEKELLIVPALGGAERKLTSKSHDAYANAEANQTHECVFAQMGEPVGRHYVCTSHIMISAGLTKL